MIFLLEVNITLESHTRLCPITSCNVNCTLVCLNLPHNNVIVINSGAEWLVGQDAAVAHNDASFTAETARRECQMTLVTQRSGGQTKCIWVSGSNHLSSSSPRPYAFVVVKMLSMILSANRKRKKQLLWEDSVAQHLLIFILVWFGSLRCVLFALGCANLTGRWLTRLH